MKQLFFTILFSATFASLIQAQPGGEYIVSNAREFVEAIGPQRTIVVQPGDYDLSSVAHLSGENFSFSEAYDGLELEIAGLTGLKIEGAEKWQSHLITRPRYGNVIRFKGCQGISISNIKAGHGPESGYCTGGVFLFEGCQGISIDGCHLYGSGIEGLTFERTQGVSVENTIIKSCTYSIMSISQSQGIVFKKCKFFDNQEFDLVNISESDGIVFKSCEFKRNRTQYKFFNVTGSNKVVLKKVKFEGNNASHLAESEEVITQKGVKFSKNAWTGGKYGQ